MTRYSSLNDALEGRYSPGEDFQLPELLSTLGKRGLVEDVAGTSDIKSAKYKAAQRSVNRWIAGQEQGPLAPGAKQKQARAISPASQEKLNKIGSNLKFKVTIKGNIGINGRGADYERNRTITMWREKPGASQDDLEEMARLNDQYGEEAAWDKMADLYGVSIMYLVDDGKGYIDIEPWKD